MEAAEALRKMVAPSMKRPVWSGGITQIHITRVCSESCSHCTQGSNLAGRPVVMAVDDFERAVISMESYTGIIGVFGGQPTLHPQFGEICEVMRKHVPYLRRGLWTNALNGWGAHARITYNPATSNLNVHTRRENYDEFVRDWPESAPYLKGLDADSRHGAVFVALKDVEPDESKRWDMISNCDINRFWSALIGVVPGRGLRAYFCEIAYAQAALHATADDAADWPDTGLEVTPGWWRRPMSDFEQQVRLHCHACGVPLRRPPVAAIGGDREEFSETHRAIARPKTRDRRVEFVDLGGMIPRAERPATQYLPGVTPGYKGI